jgi:branched-subunit amino acid transport protein
MLNIIIVVMIIISIIRSIFLGMIKHKRLIKIEYKVLEYSKHTI